MNDSPFYNSMRRLWLISATAWGLLLIAAWTIAEAAGGESLAARPAALSDRSWELPDYSLDSAGCIGCEGRGCDLCLGRHRSVWEHYGPRFGIGYEAGDGIGFNRNFTTIEAFLPLAGAPRQDLLFADLRWLRNDSHETGLNLGLAYRRYCEQLDSTFGLSFYYDYRQVNPFDFQQLGLGAEVLGPKWEMRTSFYLPSAFDDSQTIGQQFFGNLLLLDQSALAMNGFDFEIGTRLPGIAGSDSRLQSRLFAGMYHFQGGAAPRSRIPNTTGWRARLETQLNDTLSVDLALQDDPLFQTTFSALVSLRLPSGGWSRLFGRGDGKRRKSGSDCAYDRLNTPVERLQNIVVSEVQPVVAVNPASSQPLTFLHVAENGFPGDGTFENPLPTLERLFNDPRFQAGDVVAYVHQAMPLEHNGDVTIAANTQLLSNVPLQLVATQRGLRPLPLSNAGGVFPSITGSVTLSNNSKLAGFKVQDTTKGDNIAGFVISDNVLGNGFDEAVALTNIDGAGSIVRNKFEGKVSVMGASYVGDISDNEGFQKFEVNVGNFTGDVSRNTLRGPTGLTLQIGTFTGNVTANNSEAASSAAGITADFGTFDGTFSGNTTNMNSQEGILIGAQRFSGTISNNTAEMNGSFGMSFTVNGLGTASNVRVLDNKFSGNNSGSTEFVATNDGLANTLMLELRDNTSANFVPIDFNYDLTNPGGGTFSVTPAGVNTVNVGTVGSSDGSVTIP